MQCLHRLLHGRADRKLLDQSPRHLKAITEVTGELARVRWWIVLQKVSIALKHVAIARESSLHKESGHDAVAAGYSTIVERTLDMLSSAIQAFDPEACWAA